MDNEQLDNLLALLENSIKGWRQDLKEETSLLNAFNSFSSLGKDQDLEQKRQIYEHIGRFIYERIDRNRNSLSTCLSATYFLCNETDPQLFTEETPNQQTQRLISAAREHIICIKVHYERLSDSPSCKRETEIFFIRSKDDKPNVTRIEEEIQWEDIPVDMRNSWLRDGGQKSSYQIYPS